VAADAPDAVEQSVRFAQRLARSLDSARAA